MKGLDHISYIPHSGKVCCYHCGDSYQATPASFAMLAVVIKQYGKEHRRCKKQQAGDDLLAANIAAYAALPEDKRDVFGEIVMPAPKNLGEKIAQHFYMEAMQQADLGPISIKRKDQ